jgi:hypothetical protein
MKKLVVVVLALVGSVLLLGAGSMIWAFVSAGGHFAPPYLPGVEGTYSESPARCNGNRATVTIRFARHSGRVVNNGLWGDTRNSEGCMVMLAVPKSAGPDPIEAIGEAVSPRGWERRGEATWVNAKGFTVTALPWITEDRADPSMADYDDILLIGRPASEKTPPPSMGR